MNKKLKESIKSRGYWRINFEPLVYEQKIKNLNNCKEIIQKNVVDYIGWDYPHFPVLNEEVQAIEKYQNYLLGWTDLGIHKEFWRLYLSGQFLHYMTYPIDWYENDIWKRTNLINFPTGKYLDIIYSIISPFTHIFEFLSLLGKSGIYNEGVMINIDMYGLKNRMLYSSGNLIQFLRGDKIIADDHFAYTHKLTYEDIILDTQSYARKAILQLFDLFNWNPSEDSIKAYQERLKKGEF